MPLINKKTSTVETQNEKNEEKPQDEQKCAKNNEHLDKNNNNSAIVNLAQKLNSKMCLNSKKATKTTFNRHSVILKTSISRLKRQSTETDLKDNELDKENESQQTKNNELTKKTENVAGQSTASGSVKKSQESNKASKAEKTTKKSTSSSALLKTSTSATENIKASANSRKLSDTSMNNTTATTTTTGAVLTELSETSKSTPKRSIIINPSSITSWLRIQNRNKTTMEENSSASPEKCSIEHRAAINSTSSESDQKSASSETPSDLQQQSTTSDSEMQNEASKSNDSVIECGCECDMGEINTSSASISEDNNYKYEIIVDYIKRKSREWSIYPTELIDTHCHFDMLFQKINYKKNIDHYLIDYKNYYIDNFNSCINVMCDPSKYDSRLSLDANLNSLKNPKVYGTIGCHPHFANSWNSKIENYIYTSLTHPKIVAIGECGIDVSRKNKVPIVQQEKVFLAQLKMAKETGMPIVIHCRDAEDSVFDILSENLEDNHRIHLHCFTGGWSIGKKFLDKFSNLCIGVTPLLTFSSASSVFELVKNIPIDRLLFETDAPYFIPREKFPKSKIECSHPAFIFTVVESVSKIKNISIDKLILSNRNNVKKVYGF